MEIDFQTSKLKKLCSSEKAMRGKWGPQMAEKLKQRLAELEAASVLEDMPRTAHCHELTGDLRGCLAVDLVHPKRLVFRPNHTPVPKKPDGGLDRKQVSCILIKEILDYH